MSSIACPRSFACPLLCIAPICAKFCTSLHTVCAQTAHSLHAVCTPSLHQSTPSLHQSTVLGAPQSRLAGRLESRIVCKPHLLRLSRKRASHQVTKRSARALGARGFGECRGPGFQQHSNQFVLARPRARMARGRSCTPNVCRARRRPRCQQVVDKPAAPWAGEIAHIVRDVCTGAAQKVLSRLAAPRL